MIKEGFNESIIKVLYVAFGIHTFGGANRSLLTLITNLREQYNVQPTVLVRSNGDLTKALDKLNIPWISAYWEGWIYPEGTSPRSFIVGAIRNRKNLKNALEIVREKAVHFDLIHTNTVITHMGGYLSKKLHVPHVWHFREFGREDYGLCFNRGDYLAGRYIRKHSDCLIANSRAVQEKFKKLCRINNVHLVYNGFDIAQEIIHKDFKRLHDRSEITFVSAGTVNDAKNHIEALKAADYLKNNLKQVKFKLYIAGKGSEKKMDELREYIESHGLTDYIELLGHVNDMKGLRRQLDVAVVCSRKEAFGRVTVEAMLSQMPVIGTDCGGTAEIIEHQQSGFLYPPGDYQRLAVYMNEFIENHSLIQRMGENGYRRATEMFSDQQYVEEVYRCYRAVLDKCT